VIVARDLLFRYRSGGFQLDVERFSVRPGEKVALLGPSGTGKTTLLNLLAGILIPVSGSLEISGLDIAALRQEDRQDFRAIKLGLMFQEFGLLEYLSVLENICLPYRITPVLQLDGSVLERAHSLARDVGLTEKLDRYPKHLSQGERQRIGVCRSLITQPAAILADEPTGNLDPRNRDRVTDLLFDYTAESEAALVVVTHDHQLAQRFDRAVEMQELAR
jgi:putative ABC transport system ATP-binding protein